jgi:hypothetical protein
VDSELIDTLTKRVRAETFFELITKFKVFLKKQIPNTKALDEFYKQLNLFFEADSKYDLQLITADQDHFEIVSSSSSQSALS